MLDCGGPARHQHAELQGLDAGQDPAPDDPLRPVPRHRRDLADEPGLRRRHRRPTGLTQLGARPYDASIGRFVAVDPIFTSTDPQSFNGYSYAHNSPINASDPSGLKDDFYLYAFTTVERWTKGNYRYTRIIDWYVGCSFDGWCNIGVLYGDLVAFFRNYIPPAGVPYIPPAVYKA